VTGVLVDDADELVRAWVALARDPARCAALGAAALERAGTHEWDRTLDELESVLAEATA
jgi:hypothetical protein